MASKPRTLPAGLLGPGTGPDSGPDAGPDSGVGTGGGTAIGANAAGAGGTPSASSGRRAGSLTWLQGLACGAVVTLATPSALLLLALLVPALLAMLLDDRPGRPLVRPVVLAGLAASVRPLVALWHNGHTMGASIALISDVAVLAVAWAAEAAAWLLTEIAPVIIRLMLDGRSLSRAMYLRGKRAHYVAEWGFSTDGGDDPDPGQDARQK
jgi:hypothetical protein